MTGIYKLEGRAARWVQLLVEFGHLDAEGRDRLLVAVAELAADLGHPDDRPIGVDITRRAAAMLLVPEGDQALSRILDEDWALLFG